MVMVRMAIFSAWAELQVASGERSYLADALRPRIAKLTPLWLASLREFAKLRFEPDISLVSAGTGDLDTIYAALNRETLLYFYQRSWLKLVEAIASLIDEDSEFVFDALDGKMDISETNGTKPNPAIIPYRNEPVAFFFVLFGLTFEALVSRSDESHRGKSQALEILIALKKILKPSVTGHAIYQEVVFSETMDMFDRLVQTESLNVQSVLVEIARNLCLEHPSARKGPVPREEENLSDDIEQLFELTRIIILVIAGLVPNLTEDKTRGTTNQKVIEFILTVRSEIRAQRRGRHTALPRSISFSRCVRSIPINY
jgi:HEAT repeat-containing protein 5